MNIKKLCIPTTENYLKEGLRLAVLNAGLLLIGGGIALGLLYIVSIIRMAIFSFPLPVWLITIGVGIPCFVIWFQYGKSFGFLTKERHIIRGANVAILGNIPEIICLYVLIKMSPDFIISQEVHKIILTLLIMLVVMMPIMTILGVLDAKKAGAKK